MLFKVGKTSEGDLIAYTDQERQKDILENVIDRIDEVIGRWPESYGCKHIDEIHHGYEWSDFYRSDIDTTYHITHEQSRVMNERQKNCFNSFLEENELKPETQWDDLTQDQQNDLSDYENEWFEPALLRLSIQQYELFLSINYTDQPYYRYQYDEPILKLDISETEKIDDIIKKMKTAYDEFLKEEKKA